MFDFDHIVIRTLDGGEKLPIPKYFFRCLEQDNPEKFAELKEKRRVNAENRAILKFDQYSCNHDDAMRHQKEYLESKLDKFRRSL